MVTTDNNITEKLIELDRRLETLMKLRPQNPGGFDMLIDDIKERKRKLLSTKVND